MELTEIEAQRRALEENVQKLRQSLKHWQTWEAEYEGLKEELIATGPEELTAEAVTEICKTYDGALVTEKEIRELTGQADPESPPRRRGQILGQISRRQDYVQRNIETISKQFFVAEGKLEEFAFASVTASGVYGDGIGEDDDEGGLPLSEIHEELDDDENVIRGEVRRPEEATGKVLERLRMAGLSEKDLGAAGAKVGAVQPATPAMPAAPDASPQLPSALKSPPMNAASVSKEIPPIDSESIERPPIRKKSVSFSADTKEDQTTMLRSNSEEGKKSVSFADKVAVARAADPPDTRSVSFSQDVEEIPAPTTATDLPQVPTDQVQINTDPERQKDLRAYFKPGDKVFEVDEDAETTQPHIVMPEGESEEDAALRREMLNYHLSEVNNIVATMELDDPDDDDEHDDSHSEYTASEYLDEDTPYTSGLSDSDAEDEDEFGRSTKPAITDAYRDEMEALKARLIGNLGKIDLPEEDDVDAEINPADARRLVIREKRSSIASASENSDGDKKPTPTSKKRVSFAEELDVAKPSSPPHKANKHVEGETVPPLVGGVTERTTAVSHSLPTATSPATFSRFKQSRAKAISVDEEEEDTRSGAPTGPPGIPMADTLLERTPAKVKAPDPDGYDPLLARRELASEYYRRRNDMVREHGGFKVQKDEDENLGDLMEERDDGRVKKVSRFKAARLGK